MLHLPDVTLVMVSGDYHAAHQAALNDVVAHMHFPYVLTMETEPTLEAVSEAMQELVAPTLKTSHALFIQWDGYPTTPEMWDDGFLAYDYIGAVWPWFTEHSVGNGGFSLRSRRLLGALAALPALEYPEDITICRRLNLDGMRFAPESVAERFSREHWPVGARTFGFHGVWNMLDFMDDTAVVRRLSLLEPKQWRQKYMTYVSATALRQGRRDLFLWVQGMIGRHRG